MEWAMQENNIPSLFLGIIDIVSLEYTDGKE